MQPCAGLVYVRLPDDGNSAQPRLSTMFFILVINAMSGMSYMVRLPACLHQGGHHRLRYAAWTACVGSLYACKQPVMCW